MKYFYIGVLILCLLVAGCLLTAWEIGRRTEAVAQPLALALEALRAGDEAGSRAQARFAAAEWDRHQGVLAALISHDHTNGVGEALAGLSWSQGPELGRRLEELLRRVRELAEMDRVVWRNLF